MIREIRQNPPVSVIIPSYNHSRFIQTTLEGVFAQTYKNIHLIVIDDGSTDNSPEIIEKTLKNCPFESKLIVRPNKGVVLTLNEGLEMARGEYIAPISSDDLWLPDFVGRRVSQLQSRPNAVLAYGHTWTIDENDKIIGSTMDWADYNDGDARNMLLTKNPPLGSTIVHRKSVLEKEKWKPGVFVEDYELLLRLCLLGEFAFEPNVLSAYRIHANNVSKETDSLIYSKMQSYELNAAGLGLSAQDLADIKLRLDWNTAEIYFSSGRRLKALQTAFKYSRIPIPLNAKLRQFAKLLIPQFVLQAGRKKIKRYSSPWQGTDIKDLIAKK